MEGDHALRGSEQAGIERVAAAMAQFARMVQRAAQARVSIRELNRWKEIVRQLPGVRLEKVRAARRALQDNEYECDSNEVLTRTIAQVAEDIDLSWAGVDT